MNIHSIHFEEGIKPRLRSSRETRLEEVCQQPCESYQSTTTEAAQAEASKLRDFALSLSREKCQ